MHAIRTHIPSVVVWERLPVTNQEAAVTWYGYHVSFPMQWESGRTRHTLLHTVRESKAKGSRLHHAFFKASSASRTRTMVPLRSESPVVRRPQTGTISHRQRVSFLITETKIFVLWSFYPFTKEAGRLVHEHEVSPEPSTFARKDDDYDYAW